MKKVRILLLLVVVSTNALSQSNLDKAKKSFFEYDYVKAREYALFAIQEKPKNPDAMIIAGDIYFETAALDTAMNWYKAAAKISPKNSVAVRKIGQVYTKQGNIPEAIKTLERAAKLNDKDANTYLALGEAQLKSQASVQAEQSLLKAKELDKQNIRANVLLGEFYYERSKADLIRATENYKEALKLDTTQIEVRKKLLAITSGDNKREPVKKQDAPVQEKNSLDNFIPTDIDPEPNMMELQRNLVYPEMARRAGLEGKVIIRVLIGKDGKPKPGKIRIEESSNELFNQVSLDAVMKTSFTPAYFKGQPLEVPVTVPIAFRLREKSETSLPEK